MQQGQGKSVWYWISVGFVAFVPTSFLWALLGGAPTPQVEGWVMAFDILAAIPAYMLARRIGLLDFTADRRLLGLIGRVSQAAYWAGVFLLVLGVVCFLWKWGDPAAGAELWMFGIGSLTLGICLCWIGNRNGPVPLQDDAAENTREFERQRRAAAEGSAKAQVTLAIRYLHGDGVEQDYAEAHKWVSLAVEQGDSAARCVLAEMYQEGKGVPKDLSKAVEWCRIAADDGSALGQYALGSMYAAGNGVAKDESAALHWYRMAARQDDADAQFALGEHYEYGRGVPADAAEAIKWYRLAANQGHAAAQSSLFSLTESTSTKTEKALKRAAAMGIRLVAVLLRIAGWLIVVGIVVRLFS